MYPWTPKSDLELFFTSADANEKAPAGLLAKCIHLMSRTLSATQLIGVTHRILISCEKNEAGSHYLAEFIGLATMASLINSSEILLARLAPAASTSCIPIPWAIGFFESSFFKAYKCHPNNLFSAVEANKLETATCVYCEDQRDLIQTRLEELAALLLPILRSNFQEKREQMTYIPTARLFVLLGTDLEKQKPSFEQEGIFDNLQNNPNYPELHHLVGQIIDAVTR